jgi:hypothetical protein
MYVTLPLLLPITEQAPIWVHAEPAYKYLVNDRTIHRDELTIGRGSTADHLVWSVRAGNPLDLPHAHAMLDRDISTGSTSLILANDLSLVPNLYHLLNIKSFNVVRQ